MKIRITRPAGRQFHRILTYLREISPQGERHVEDPLNAVLQILVAFPFAGQTTRKRGVRRILVSPYPYAITYRVSGK